MLDGINSLRTAIDWTSFMVALSMGVFFHISFIKFESRAAMAVVTLSQVVAALIVASIQPNLFGYVIVTRISDFVARWFVEMFRRELDSQVAKVRSSNRVEKWETSPH